MDNEKIALLSREYAYMLTRIWRQDNNGAAVIL